METVSSLGLMDELTKGRTWMTRKKDTALLLGPMVVSMLAHGLTVSRTAWVPIPPQLENQNKASGGKESVLHGSELICLSLLFESTNSVLNINY